MRFRAPWLAERGKGSFYNQEQLIDELNCDHKASKEAEMNASRHKIQLQETVETEEIDEEKWTKFKESFKLKYNSINLNLLNVKPEWFRYSLPQFSHKEPIFFL